MPTHNPDPTEVELMLKGYGLSTVEVTYRIPDFRLVLTTFGLQLYDIAPDFPELTKFVTFWITKLDGPLHSVRYTHQKLLRPGEWRNVSGEFRLH